MKARIQLDVPLAFHFRLGIWSFSALAPAWIFFLELPQGVKRRTPSMLVSFQKRSLRFIYADMFFLRVGTKPTNANHVEGSPIW